MLARRTRCASIVDMRIGIEALPSRPEMEKVWFRGSKSMVVVGIVVGVGSIIDWVVDVTDVIIAGVVVIVSSSNVVVLVFVETATTCTYLSLVAVTA